MLIKKRRKQSFSQDEENKNYREEYKDGDSRSHIQSLQNQILELSEKLDRKHKESEKQIKYADMLGDLYQRGIIDEDGNVLDPP